MEDHKSLRLADSATQSIGAAAPLSESFPSSEKVAVGELAVPVRRILLGGDEPPLTVYDTSGPEGIDPRAGLPKRRAPWLTERLANSDGNLSQMHYARRGIVTEEMRFAALREN